MSEVVKHSKISTMVEHPIILVISEGDESPEKIIENLRKQPESDNVEKLITAHSTVINGYKLHLSTKYYETDLFMVPFKDHIDLLPTEIREATEAVLIYFDAGKRSFSDKIPKYADFLKENCIELGILLCDQLYDNSNEGITYKDAKQASRFLDVIELGRTREEGEDDDPHDPLGYDEVMQALKSFLWSNVQMNGATKPPVSSSSDERETSNAAVVNEARENSVENELEMFEKLLSEAMMFKNATSSMTRNERLAYAEQFASKFEELIGDGPNSSDEG